MASVNLCRTADILQELKLLFASVADIPVQVLLTGYSYYLCWLPFCYVRYFFYNEFEIYVKGFLLLVLRVLQLKDIRNLKKPSQRNFDGHKKSILWEYFNTAFYKLQNGNFLSVALCCFPRTMRIIQFAI